MNKLKYLKSLYLNSSLWNIAFPFIIGLFVNYELSDSRTLIIYLIWLPIISLPYFLFRKKIFVLFAWFVSMAFGLLDMIHWVAIKAPVSIYSLYVMFETSFSEAE